MTKVRTFMQNFPAKHINAGKPTFFVEKILNGLEVNYQSHWYLHRLFILNRENIEKGKLTFQNIEGFWMALQETKETKYHTIRNGFSLKKGEKISPRTWYEKPYASPQIIFWEDLEIISTQEFYNDNRGNWLVDKAVLGELERISLAMGDGLDYENMLSWFDTEFHGQIIAWSHGCLYRSN